MSDHKYWLGFSLIPSIGIKRILKLHNWFGSLADAWQAKESDLHRAGLEEKPTQHLLNHRQKINLNAEMEKVERVKASLITMLDVNYPELLKEIDSPPAVLYVRGTLSPADRLSISVVGTRKATKYGKDAAYDLSHQLAQHGVTIISGMAHGVDAAAHQGAINGGGRTIAVMGCGVDVIYPRDHEELARKITQNGAIISEFPIGTQPVASNFPRRNRILSGMSLGVMVVEAPESSGALITASQAGEQGREVFAVPGNVYSLNSRGANRLIQDGAKLVMSPEDVLDEINVAHENINTRVRTEAIAPSNSIEAQLIEYLHADPIHIDDLVRLSGLSIIDVSSTLTILELKGLAQMVGHMQYSLVNKR